MPPLLYSKDLVYPMQNVPLFHHIQLIANFAMRRDCDTHLAPGSHIINVRKVYVKDLGGAMGAVVPPSLQPQGIQKTQCIDIKMH